MLNDKMGDAEGRTGKQCRERWVCHLHPDLHRAMGGVRGQAPWTKEEEAALVSAHRACGGNHWKEIAGGMHGRSQNDVKNYWNSTRRRNERAVEGVLREYIQELGLMPAGVTL
jgi:hypothetical protein